MISIIIPVYNRANLIKETLEFLKDYYEGVSITTMQGVEEKTVFKPLLNFS